MRLRAGDGRGRRQSESVGAEGWAGEECVEWELAAVKGGGEFVFIWGGLG